LNKLPFSLVLFRLLLAPLMVVWAWGDLRAYFGADWLLLLLLWAGMISDILDGIIARYLGVADDRLRKWDAQVDVIFWLAAGACVWKLNGRLFQAHLYWIILLFLLEPVSDLINFFKFRKAACAHNWLSKLWGILLVITFTLFFAGRQPVLLFRLCLLIGALSQVDRIIISSLLPRPECDIPSSYHAYLRKKGRTFKRYKLFN
jgi:hypothetical protein